MLPTIRGIVEKGEIKPLEDVSLPEGSEVLITLLTDADRNFWQAVSQHALDKIWGNTEDDVYAELLEE